MAGSKPDLRSITGSGTMLVVPILVLFLAVAA